MRFRFARAVALLLAFTLPACAQSPATKPYEPVTYTHEVRQNPPLHIHVVTIDLTDPRVHVTVARSGPDPDGDGPWETTLQTVRAVAERERLDVAVNGDFFNSKSVMHLPGLDVPYYVGNAASACGWAMSDGVLWSARPAGGSLLVDDKGKVSIVRLGGRPPASVRHIVSGLQLLVSHGQNVAPPQLPAPRTAVGINAAGTRLVLHVVDGRRPDYSVGMTLKEQADELIKLGCDTVLHLDGGGSSTLVIRDPQSRNCQVINRPSDGHQLLIPLSIERAVGNVLGVTIDKPATQPAVEP